MNETSKRKQSWARMVGRMSSLFMIGEMPVPPKHGLLISQGMAWNGPAKVKGLTPRR